MKTIGYVCQYDPFKDRKAWSGTIYKIREGIENAGYKVIWVRISPPQMLMNIVVTLLKIRYRFADHHPWIFRVLSKYTDWETAKKCDMLFFPNRAQIMKYAPFKIPYIYYTDVNFCQMVNYYWYNLKKRHIKLANDEEKWAINNAKINIRASEWATNNAVDFYGDAFDKNFVLEFGANIDDKDIVESQMYEEGQLNVLFSGVDWDRKGGDIAVGTVRTLRSRYGIDAYLNVVGIKSLPSEYQGLEYVRTWGFLNKNIRKEYELYIDIIKKNHIFLLPTKAECAGIVFCEASAFGLPIFTYDTGGIGNYVIDGKNGYRLKMGSDSDNFATKIHDSIISKELLKLHNGALNIYSEKLNWISWSKNFRTLIEDNCNDY